MEGLKGFREMRKLRRCKREGNITSSTADLSILILVEFVSVGLPAGPQLRRVNIRYTPQTPDIAAPLRR